MKKNNKGFTLIETLITSTLVVSVLVFLLVQFTTLNRNYDYSFSFNTIQGIYNAKTLSKYLTDNHTITCNYDTDPCDLTENIDDNLKTKLNIKTVIMMNDNIDYRNRIDEALNNNICGGAWEDNKCYEIAKKYIKNNIFTKTSKTRLIIRYKDNTYATILMNN